MKNLPLKFFLFSTLLWAGCDSVEDKKGRFLLKGNEKMEENDPKSAIEFYQEAIALDSTFADAYYNKGMAHLRLNQLEEAIIDFSQTLQKNPEFVDALFQRGLSYLDNGEFYKAKADAKKLGSQTTADWRSYFLMGLTEEKLVNFPAALSAFKKAAELNPTNSDLLVNQATIHFYQKEYATTLAILEKAEGINPLEPNLHNLRSMVFFDQKNYQGALNAVEKAISLDKGQAYFYNNKGLYLLYLNQYEEGLTLINQSLAMNDKNPFALRNKGIYYTLTGDKVAALNFLEELAASYPDMDLLAEYVAKARSL
jgi:tetratricopeptide (TPR) repeat protein